MFQRCRTITYIGSVNRPAGFFRSKFFGLPHKLDEVFSPRSPDPVRDVRRREQQNDVLWARQEMSWLPKAELVAAKCSPRAPRVKRERPKEVPQQFLNPQRYRRRSRDNPNSKTRSGVIFERASHSSRVRR